MNARYAPARRQRINSGRRPAHVRKCARSSAHALGALVHALDAPSEPPARAKALEPARPVPRLPAGRGRPRAARREGPRSGGFVFHHLGEGHEQDLEVEHERPVVDVPDVEGAAALPVRRAAAMDRRPPGHARPKLVATRLLGGTVRQISRRQRTRPDQAHLAAQHIDQCAGRPSRLVARSQPPSRVKRCHSGSVAPPVRSRGPGAELQQLKRAAMTSGPDLTQQHRRAQRTAHRKRKQHEERPEHDQTPTAPSTSTARLAGQRSAVISDP